MAWKREYAERRKRKRHEDPEYREKFLKLSRDYAFKWRQEYPEKAKQTAARHYQKNKKKMNEDNRKWCKNNKEYRNKYRTLVKYGLTQEEYDKLFEDCKGKCAICNGESYEGFSKLCVDHCHRTGVIRGLLCRNCNSAIGLLQDDPKLLRKAARYLLKNKSKQTNTACIAEIPA